MKSFTVRYERDNDGWWVATVVQLQGCHTQGRSIRQARRRIREAIGLFVKGSKDIELIDDIKLPVRVVQLVNQFQEHKKFVETEQEIGQKLATEAVQLLTTRLHLSCRDISEILHISHQRVQQLASTTG